MFNDDELKSIMRYIDMYHETTSAAVRSRAIKFLTLKLREKLPGVGLDKTIEIMKEFHPSLFGIKDISFVQDDYEVSAIEDDRGKSKYVDSSKGEGSELDKDLKQTKPYVIPTAKERLGSQTDRGPYNDPYKRQDFRTGLLSERNQRRPLGDMMAERRNYLMNPPGLRDRYHSSGDCLIDRYRSRDDPLTDRYRTEISNRTEICRPPPVVPRLDTWKIQRDRDMTNFTDRSRRLAIGIDEHSNGKTDSFASLEKEIDELVRLRGAQERTRGLTGTNSTYIHRLLDTYSTPETETSKTCRPPVIAPDWMVRQEKEYYQSLSDVDKLKLIDSYDAMKALDTSDLQPLRLQILTSNVPDKKKSEIFSRLDSSMPGLGEGAKYMSWVNSLLTVPFGVHTTLPCKSDSSEDVNKYMAECKELFDTEVYGHEKIKNEFLTVIGSWIKAGASHEHGNVIGVTGPIGVGKTTLIKEGLAKALGRPFYFISLGGTSYSAFLQGHGYTYEGSTYGEIVRGVIESGCMDPVFYFDELDKVATDGKGDEVIHALIHLTDPAQNDQFSDRYFAGIDIDVSKALFVFSYNHREKVNPILRDRIHEIVLEDFTLSEKTDIATKYVLPKISKGMSLELDPLLTFADGCIEHLVDLCEESTGMRTLKMVLVRMLRILNLAEMSDGELVLNVDKTLVTGKAPYTVTKDLIDELYKFCESTEKEANVSNSMMYM